MTIKQIMDYFNADLDGSDPRKTLKSFSAEWKQLTDADKAQIKQGLADGTFDY